jgi:hypothetical protein
MFIHNLLNVLVQTANKMRLKIMGKQNNREKFTRHSGIAEAVETAKV